MAATARRLRDRLAVTARGGGGPSPRLGEGLRGEVRELLRGVAAHPAGSLVASANTLALAALVNRRAALEGTAPGIALEIALQLRRLREGGAASQRAHLRAMRGLQAVLRLGSEAFSSAVIACPLLLDEIQAAAAVAQPPPPTFTQRTSPVGSPEDTAARLGDVARAVQRWTDFARSGKSERLRAWLAVRADAFWEEALMARTEKVEALAVEAVCESKLYWLASREEAAKKLQRAVRRYLSARRTGPVSHRLRSVPSNFEIDAPGAAAAPSGPMPHSELVRHLFPASAA